jgi:hypothetical protein
MLEGAPTWTPSKGEEEISDPPSPPALGSALLLPSPASSSSTPGAWKEFRLRAEMPLASRDVAGSCEMLPPAPPLSAVKVGHRTTVLFTIASKGRNPCSGSDASTGCLQVGQHASVLSAAS